MGGLQLLIIKGPDWNGCTDDDDDEDDEDEDDSTASLFWLNKRSDCTAKLSLLMSPRRFSGGCAAS